MADTQHFVISIDEGNSQGVYCAYCGKKITPEREENGSFYFQCDCTDASREKQLYVEKSKVEQDLEHFLIQKTDTMQINELRTRVVIYEQHVHELKKRLQEVMNKVAGVIPPDGASVLVVKLSQEEEPLELKDEDEVHPEEMPLLEIEEDEISPYPQSFNASEEEYAIPDLDISEISSCHDAPMVSAEAAPAANEDYEEICAEIPFFDSRKAAPTADPFDSNDLPDIKEFD